MQTWVSQQLAIELSNLPLPSPVVPSNNNQQQPTHTHKKKCNTPMSCLKRPIRHRKDESCLCWPLNLSAITTYPNNQQRPYIKDKQWLLHQNGFLLHSWTTVERIKSVPSKLQNNNCPWQLDSTWSFLLIFQASTYIKPGDHPTYSVSSHGGGMWPAVGMWPFIGNLMNEKWQQLSGSNNCARLPRMTWGFTPAAIQVSCLCSRVYDTTHLCDEPTRWRGPGA